MRTTRRKNRLFWIQIAIISLGLLIAKTNFSLSSPQNLSPVSLFSRDFSQFETVQMSKGPRDTIRDLRLTTRSKLISGDFIGPYKIKSLLGFGAWGKIYSAIDTRTKAEVAVKILENRESVHDEQKFLQEAKILTHLEHPNIVTFYELHQGNKIYYSMEEIKGKDLEKKLFDNLGPLPYELILSIGIQTARALEYLHEQGVTHRDIKPGNLILEEITERVVLIDFSIGLINGEGPSPNDEVAGTPNYMSPEQANSIEEDYRVDIYSLGSTLYHLSTGRPAYRERTILGLLTKLSSKEKHDSRKSVFLVNTELPYTFNEFIKKAMAFDPEERYQTATEMREALEDLLLSYNRTRHTPPGGFNFTKPKLSEVRAQKSIATAI